MTLKLEEKTIELCGKTYVLHANMSVLDRVQEEHDGDVAKLMATPINQAMAEILSAMLNDWSEDQGWEEEWTVRKVKKYFSAAMLRDLDVIPKRLKKKQIPIIRETDGPGGSILRD